MLCGKTIETATKTYMYMYDTRIHMDISLCIVWMDIPLHCMLTRYIVWRQLNPTHGQLPDACHLVLLESTT